MPRRLRLPGLVALLALLAACGAGESITPNPPPPPPPQPPPPPPPAPVATVVVSPDSSDVSTGGTVQLSATPKDAAGNALAGRTITWTTSDPALATVSNTGLVTTVVSGRVVVSGTAEGKSGTAVVRVKHPFDTLPGAPTALAGAAVAKRVVQTRAQDFSTDHPQLPGISISFNTILVSLAPDATIGQVNTLLVELGAEIVGGVPGVPGQLPALLGLRLGTRTHAELTQRLVTIRGKSFVRTASPDVILTPLVVPRASATSNPSGWDWTAAAGGGNWGLEITRAPAAWNLNETIRRSGVRTKTGVFDVGFGSHADLVYAAQTSLGFLPDDKGHGTHVAGTIGAQFDNQIGVDGMNPFADLFVFGGATSLTWITGIADILETQPGIRVLNLSLGYNWRLFGLSPGNNPTVRAAADVEGALFRDALALYAAQPGHKLPVIVAAAGNDSKAGAPELANYASPFANAGLAQGAAPVIVVEAVDLVSPGRGDLAAFSNAGGHVSAPGVQIMSTLPNSTYGARNGTSMAAPHVTGLIGFLYALEPSLPAPTMTSNPLRDLLIRTTTPALGGAAPLIDAFNAAMEVDRFVGGSRVLHALLDVDDGTQDGNLRLLPDGTSFISTDADGSGGLGDGRVDMSDFRRWRDWLLDAEGNGSSLDGPPDHPKRDLNGNGVLTNIDPIFETMWSRGDFNGDGRLLRTGQVSVYGVMNRRLATDLEVLQELFSDPDYNEGELPGLIDSGDLSVNPARCLATPGAQSVRSSLRLRNVQASFDNRSHTSANPVHVYTLASSPGLYTARLDALDQAGVSIASTEEDFTIVRGGDQHWDPVCKALDVTASFPASLQSGVPAALVITAMLRNPASGPGFPEAGAAVSIQATGGFVAQASGFTNTAGLFSTMATLGPTSSSLTLTIKVSIPGGVSKTITVQAGTTISVTISPLNSSVVRNTQKAFTATVTGTSNTAVTWTATGGTINSAGTYTAGSTLGAFTVTATSVADPTTKASTSITIVTGTLPPTPGLSISRLAGINPANFRATITSIPHDSVQIVFFAFTQTGQDFSGAMTPSVAGPIVVDQFTTTRNASVAFPAGWQASILHITITARACAFKDGAMVRGEFAFVCASAIYQP